MLPSSSASFKCPDAIETLSSSLCFSSISSIPDVEDEDDEDLSLCVSEEASESVELLTDGVAKSAVWSICFYNWLAILFILSSMSYSLVLSGTSFDIALAFLLSFLYSSAPNFESLPDTILLRFNSSYVKTEDLMPNRLMSSKLLYFRSNRWFLDVTRTDYRDAAGYGGGSRDFRFAGEPGTFR